MAEVPNCRNFPPCGQRHFGACDSPFIRSLESGSRKTVRDVDGQIPVESREPRPVDTVPNPPELQLYELQGRVATLEKLIDELLAVKRKRSRYMKFYMRRKRREEAACE